MMEMEEMEEVEFVKRCHVRKRSLLGFDEFGFAIFRKYSEEWSEQHRTHEYSHPQTSGGRLSAWAELLESWSNTNTFSFSKLRALVREGVPPETRGRLWKCLLGSDILQETSTYNYQECVSGIRRQLVDLGVSEYSVHMALATLCQADNSQRRQRTESQSSESPLPGSPSLAQRGVQMLSLEPESRQVRYVVGSPRQSGMEHHANASAKEPKPVTSDVVDVLVLRQIILDLDRSFPTHRSLMGESPEAKEGRASLFRVLSAYARYNPRIGYCQGMSYLASMLLMNMVEEDAFWALVSLLERPKYLAGFFHRSLDRIQRHAKVFQRLLQHRIPKLCQHLEELGVEPLMFITPWFLTLFTSLPCWDTVLAVWDLIMLDGLNVMFRLGLSILQLLEERLLEMADVSQILPALLRVPADVKRHGASQGRSSQAWEPRGAARRRNKGPQQEESKRAPQRRAQDGRAGRAVHGAEVGAAALVRDGTGAPRSARRLQSGGRCGGPRAQARPRLLRRQLQQRQRRQGGLQAAGQLGRSQGQEDGAATGRQRPHAPPHHPHPTQPLLQHDQWRGRLIRSRAERRSWSGGWNQRRGQRHPGLRGKKRLRESIGRSVPREEGHVPPGRGRAVHRQRACRGP
ncbi:uncharacterized protein LOC133350352 isoform X2 [Lethenteron reissneri]|uniref:uncharacterized protein LOC133350352 isoform X2 n=1 Tax=Lethenteron reissneri TaxID=7753 RepID=UPI002AB606FD|nr:uncharacterized protein LOC133350352 isoform X2 [Lethenteron reissneri]